MYLRRTLILFFVCEIQSANILALLPHVGRSHFLTFEPLLKTLAERGHHVTVVSLFPSRTPVENYTDVSLASIAAVRKEVFNLALFDSQNFLVNVLGLRTLITQINAFKIQPAMALNMCSKLVNFTHLAEALEKDYDVVLLENFNSDCLLGLLHVYGIKAPTISLTSCPMPPWLPGRLGLNDNPSYVPIISAETTSRMSFLRRLENTIMNYGFKVWFRYNIQMKEREIIEKHFKTRIPDLQDLASSVTMMLTNTFHSLNGVRPLLPGVVEVGGLHLKHPLKPLPHYIERFLNESEHGVVLFSWGSLIKTATIPKYKEDIIVNALSKIKQRVIWKYEDSDEEGTLTGNILKVKWIPQYELLQHKKVIAFIGHGGLLGMTEAISAGKPMLIVPFYGDQPLNGAAATEIGLGKTISYADMTEKSLLEGLQTVLSAEMRLSARRASKIWQDRIADPMETAIYWVERVIRWGDLDPLHSTARELSFIEYNLLDVLAVISLVVIFLLILVWIVFNQILRLLSASFHSKEKLH